MRCLTAVAVAGTLLISGFDIRSAHSASADFSKSVICQILQPCWIPVRYRHGPYLAEPLVREVALRDLQARCGATIHVFGSSEGNGYLGCARLEGDHCIIYIPHDVRALSANLYDMILEHELAHCRGWTHRAYRR